LFGDVLNAAVFGGQHPEVIKMTDIVRSKRVNLLLFFKRKNAGLDINAPFHVLRSALPMA
jgi:hypothetical protein